MNTARVDTPVRLRARSRRLSEHATLLGALGSGGFAWLGDDGFVTAGTAALVAPDDAVDLLGTIEIERDTFTDDAIAPRVRAVGALAFDGAGQLRVPARIVERRPDGALWCTEISDCFDDAPDIAPASSGSAPTRVEIHAATTRAEFDASVRAALDLIAGGSLSKVVLARPIDVVADVPFDVAGVLGTLLRSQPGCRVYADGGFVGATPELLVRRDDAVAVARPMAGTVARDGDVDAAVARLLGSRKDAHEHALVVDAVVEALRSFGSVTASGPVATPLADVAHLCTEVRCELTQPGAATVVELVRRLHPTPAVGGSPTALALDAIARLEAAPRGRYAGPCGWVDANGDGEFVVALRCAQLSGRAACLHAGVGIVAGSDVDAEFAETQAKFAPMLHALTRV